MKDMYEQGGASLQGLELALPVIRKMLGKRNKLVEVRAWNTIHGVFLPDNISRPTRTVLETVDVGIAHLQVEIFVAKKRRTIQLGAYFRNGEIKFKPVNWIRYL